MAVGSVDLLFNVLVLVATTTGSLVSGACEYTDDVCEFSLVIKNELTMMQKRDLVYPYNGKLYRYNETDPSTANDIPMEEIVTADGYENPRVVTLANGSLPGPPLIVYEGQMVVVNVINKLSSDGVTIHWHGVPQRDSPWMDGVAYITQCPIMPGQSFRYEFKATPRGTYWYHSHIGSQRSNGLYGAFVIRPRIPLEVPEHILTIADWNHDGDSDLTEIKQFRGTFENRIPVPFSKSADGSLLAKLQFHSGLINGRGRFYDPLTDVHNAAPLSVFGVEAGKVYRFRIINAGMVYPFQFSVDNHTLVAVASDGYDFEPLSVDALNVFPGERYDVLLQTSNVIDSYWIRTKTLEVEFNHRTEAILRYAGAPDDVEPTTTARNCSDSNHCRVLNCPSSKMPPNQYIDCLTMNDIKSTNPSPLMNITDSLSNQTQKSNSTDATNDIFKEVFLNFGFPGTSSKPGSVNGREFVFPSVSGLTQMDEIERQKLCENADCGPDKICTCFHSLTLDQVDIVQMVLLNMGNGQGWGHPIHMHGHSFEVLKTGYSILDENGQIYAPNPDIRCLGQTFGTDTFCNSAEWTNSSWKNGNIPGLELQRPPIKDTVILPSGGYVVIRIKADNPGLWIMHCHVELHSIYGMALVINESHANVPKAPAGFPECRSFPSTAMTSGTRHKRSATYMVPENSRLGGQSDSIAHVTDRWVFTWTVTFLGSIIFIQTFIIMFVCGTMKLKKAGKWT
ncbi:laccase-1-like [Pecten maximus]|uniref:laccase-1-like n=1 Tax=Pecten maximus TaxID=6579 RepID=UPI001458C9DB|nr:laccase-1-like [Pecten maximus]